MLGTPLLFDTLFSHGMEDLAFRMLTRCDYPGYGHMVKSGATTPSWTMVSSSGIVLV